MSSLGLNEMERNTLIQKLEKKEKNIEKRTKGKKRKKRRTCVMYN